jgi:DNA-binding response OmpR family regulator
MDTVLVVDDDRFFLTILGDFVTQHLGMRPLLVQDGAAALSLLQSEPVDLVLLDIIMPGMDGLEVLQRIKDRRPSLPVVMVSVSSTIEHVISALREGADDFVRKPVDFDELRLAVGRALSKSRAINLPSPPRTAANERRQAARVRLRERAPGQLQLREVDLIDISLSGALVEHTKPVRPGEIYRLSFVVNGERVEVLARAVRVYLSHRVTMAGGERQVVYRTGMEFVGVDRPTQDRITEYIEHLAQPEAGKANV